MAPWSCGSATLTMVIETPYSIVAVPTVMRISNLSVEVMSGSVVAIAVTEWRSACCLCERVRLKRAPENVRVRGGRDSCYAMSQKSRRS